MHIVNFQSMFFSMFNPTWVVFKCTVTLLNVLLKDLQNVQKRT